MGGIFAHLHGCGRCTKTEASIEDGLLHDGYSSMPIVYSSFESNK